MDSSVLPYATVLDVTNKTLRSANRNGECNITLEENKIFRISYVGFADKEFIVNITDKSKTIFLLPKATTLKAVLLQPCKITKDTKIVSIKERDGSLFGGVLFSNIEKSNGKFAVHLYNNKTWAKLLKLSFWLKRSLFMPEKAVKSPLAMSFYSFNETTKTPGELLYEKPIFIFPKKEGIQTVVLDSLNIILPSEGIFVCFEIILDTVTQWSYKGIHSNQINQGVMIEGAYSEGYGFSFFDYKNNTWFRPSNLKEYDAKKLHGSLKLETVFNICKE